jgi:hypothetical protein
VLDCRRGFRKLIGGVHAADTLEVGFSPDYKDVV